jgi:glycine betaine/choline ABC-type transport system substrate-binding protein
MSFKKLWNTSKWKQLSLSGGAGREKLILLYVIKQVIEDNPSKVVA